MKTSQAICMKPILLFTVSWVLLLLTSCGNKEEREAKTNAEKVIEALTPERLATFKQWTYSDRGGFWYKDTLGKTGSTTRYAERNDSLILTVKQPAQFIRDFELDIPIEERLNGLTLIKSVDTCFFISEDAIIGGYRWTTLDCSVDTVFKRGNPFFFFRDLTRFKDAHDIQGIEHLGDKVIQFYLADGWVLTYLPGGSAAGLDKEWQEELGRGELIEEHWNLRRYNKLRPTP